MDTSGHFFADHWTDDTDALANKDHESHEWTRMIYEKKKLTQNMAIRIPICLSRIGEFENFSKKMKNGGKSLE